MISHRPTAAAVGTSFAIVVGLSVACGFLDPAGSMLAEAEGLQDAGDFQAAIAAYDVLITEHPGSEAANTASKRVEEARLAWADTPGTSASDALELTLQVSQASDRAVAALATIKLPERYTSAVAATFAENPWNAGVLAAEGMRHPALTRDNFGTTLASYRDDSPDLTDRDVFAAGFAWTIEDEKPQHDRVALGIELIKNTDHAPLVVAAIGSYLEEHVPVVLGPLCSGDPSNIDEIAVLEDRKAVCATITEYVPESEAASSATASITAIDARIGAIKSSPAYRTAAALQVCRDWFAWVKPRRRSIRTQEQAWAFQEEIERRGPRELEPALDYLRRRMDSLSDQEARYRLMRQVQTACGQ